MARGPAALHVAAASLNQTVGDWRGNRERLVAACEEARRRGAVVLALPEMAITGYSLGDRVWMRGTLERAWDSLMALLPHTRGLVLPLGLPIAHRGTLLDAVAVAVDGELVGLVPKENLATGDLQYENRWYAGWNRGRVETFLAPDGTRCPLGSLVFDIEGVGPVAFEVCEDGWLGERPGSHAALSGARVVVNASASWFTLGKQAIRRRLVREVSRQDRVVYLYASLRGCDATRLVFDGATFIAAGGQVVAEGDRFVFHDDVVMTDGIVDLAAIDRARLGEGSWRAQEQAQAMGERGQRPQVVEVAADLPVATADVRAPEAPYWGGEPSGPLDPSLDHLQQAGLLPPLAPGDLHHAELELALCLGLSEYLRKSGLSGVALALSGGRDSSMCAVLLGRMVRYAWPELSEAACRDKVAELLWTAYLSTDLSGSATRAAARAVAEQLGATHLEVPVSDLVATQRALAEEAIGRPLDWSRPADDLTLQNLQARVRGSMIWTLANVEGRLLLTTSNKSEAAVGYTTMDGDTSGGFAPIADVPKSLVSAWLAWARRVHGLDALDLVLGTPATAELRPAERSQTDEADLMPFDVLDRLMHRFAYLGEEPAVLLRRLWPTVAHHYEDVHAFADHVERFVRLFCRAQWKRERLAISLRVTAFDLDPRTGFRFPAVQDPFRDELVAMREEARRLAASDV